MAVPIILVQSALLSRADVPFDAMGLKHGKDYVFGKDPEQVAYAMATNQHQLLIIGTMHGLEKPTRDFVAEAKKRNAQLEVWFCSSMPCRYPEAYDRVLDGKSLLVEEVRAYLSRQT